MSQRMRAVGTSNDSVSTSFSQQNWSIVELTWQYKLDIKGGRGPASALFINPDTPKPVPGPSQALVKVKAFGVNRMDVMQREGKYPVPPQAPSTMGVEFSGIIESLGDCPVQGFNEGDAVFGLAYGGLNTLEAESGGILVLTNCKRSVCRIYCHFRAHAHP